MPTTYFLNGYRTVESEDTGNVISFSAVQLSVTFPNTVAEVSYSVEQFSFFDFEGQQFEDFAEVSPAPLALEVNGIPAEDLHPPLDFIFAIEQLDWSQGSTIVFTLYYDDSLTEFGASNISVDYFFDAGGAPLPTFNSFDDFLQFQNAEFGNADDPTRVPTGTFAPNQPILLSNFAWVSTASTPDELEVFGGPQSETLNGGFANDVLSGLGGDDTLNGFGGDDRLTGGPGDDTLNGGEGRDTSAYEGDMSSFTLTLSPTSTVIEDRRNISEGRDTLISIEELDFLNEIPVFGGAPMQLDRFDGPTSLFAADFAAITELYIAYFNRAPDAIGLYFWATEFANGLSIEDMAVFFFNQAETRATYADALDESGTTLTDVDTFVTAVYSNVLGRAFDEAGRQFWTGVLQDGSVTPASFISEIIKGAKAPADDDATQAFKDQKTADVAYLSTKTDIGAYFAVIKGMSDVGNASSAMALFDGSDASITSSVAAIDGFFADAQVASTAEFLMPLVGVIDDPFAV